MASCTQIESMLQACIDDELRPSERVIIDQHLEECGRCRALLKKQQRTTALLFEVHADHRMHGDLGQTVLDHLPEMRPSKLNVQGARMRENSPGLRRSLQLMSALAAALLVVLAGILYEAWPRTWLGVDEGIGMVTQLQGVATCAEPSSRDVDTASLMGVVRCGERFETGPGAHMMITLRGPTNVKLAEHTQMRIRDHRRIEISQGRAWLHVGHDERPFYIDTPSGEIAVLGTVLHVEVEAGQTVVTVKHGKVRVKNTMTATHLVQGEQVHLVQGLARLTPQRVDVEATTGWADAIEADEEAYALFLTEIQPRTATEFTAEQAFVILTNKDGEPMSVSSICLTWEPDPYLAGHCGYQVYVYDDRMQELFREHIDGSVFADKERFSYEIAVPERPLSDLAVLHIKVVPENSSGAVETPFTKVSAMGV